MYEDAIDQAEEKIKRQLQDIQEFQGRHKKSNLEVMSVPKPMMNNFHVQEEENPFDVKKNADI